MVKGKWKNIANKLKLFSKQNNRKILFTEYGYLTVDGCADKCWELEGKVNQLNQNQKAQANSFEALYSTYWSKDYWAGGFIWKWFPEGMGHEGYKSKDYCPQDKEAENIIAKWYGK